MLGISRRPQAKSVMVFTGKNQRFHASRGGGADDLVGIKICRIEQGLTFVAVAPFFVCEGVHGEMDEAAKFEFVPLELAGGWHGAEGGRRVDCAQRRTKRKNSGDQYNSF